MIQKVKLITREGKKVMGYRVTVTSDFHSNIENIWDKIQDIDTLREICKPKASFIACDDSPIQWKEGKTFVFKMYLHGFLPVGRHTINGKRVRDAAFFLIIMLVTFAATL